MLRKGLVDKHTDIARGVVVRKLLFGADYCSLEIVKFVSGEGFSIDVVFSLEYITSGELREEIKVFEDSAFFVEQSAEGVKSLKRGNPIRVRGKVWRRESKTIEGFGDYTDGSRVLH